MRVESQYESDQVDILKFNPHFSLTLNPEFGIVVLPWGGSGQEPEMIPVEPDLGNASEGNRGE